MGRVCIEEQVIKIDQSEEGYKVVIKCNQHIFDMECFVGSFAELFLQNRTIKDIVKTVQNEAQLIKVFKEN